MVESEKNVTIMKEKVLYSSSNLVWVELVVAFHLPPFMFSDGYQYFSKQQ
jgi:hypothetical protein